MKRQLKESALDCFLDSPVDQRGQARMDSTRLTGPGLGHDGRMLFFVTGAAGAEGQVLR